MVGAIEAAVFVRLKAVLPAGIDVYLHEIPEEERGSCVVVEASLAKDGDGSAPIYAAEVRTGVYTELHAANETLAGQVSGALNGWMYGAAGLRLGPLQLEGVDPGFEVLWDQYRVTLTWSAAAVLWQV